MNAFVKALESRKISKELRTYLRERAEMFPSSKFQNPYSAILRTTDGLADLLKLQKKLRGELELLSEQFDFRSRLATKTI